MVFIVILGLILLVLWWLSQPTDNTRTFASPAAYPDTSVERGNERPSRTYIEEIERAIAASRDIHIEYKKKDGTVTQRTVTPRELRRLSIPELKRLIGVNVNIQKEGRLCVFGHCHLRDDDRVFAVSRIQDLRIC